MDEAGKQLNIKKHVVGSAPEVQKELSAPLDIEVHRGKDGRIYLLDTARVFPPAQMTTKCHAVYIPASGEGIRYLQMSEKPAQFRTEAAALFQENNVMNQLTDFRLGAETAQAGTITITGTLHAGFM